MAIETDDWDFDDIYDPNAHGDFHVDDEDTSDDGIEDPDTSDTMRPPPGYLPKSTREAIEALDDGAVKIGEISKPPKLPSKDKILQKVREHAKEHLRLEPEYLDILKVSESSDGLSYLVCRFRGTDLFYVYISEANKNPDFVRPRDNVPVPIDHSGSTALLQVSRNGRVKRVVYIWTINLAPLRSFC